MQTYALQNMLEKIRAYCLHKKHATESLPFDKNTLVFKVHNKIFALLRLEKNPLQITLKCNPKKAIELREEYYQIIPGYHANKKHWNTIIIENLPIDLIFQCIDESYQLVFDRLPKKMKY